MESPRPEDYKRISEFIVRAQALSDNTADDLFERSFPNGDLARAHAQRLWNRAKRLRSEDNVSGTQIGEDLSVHGVEISRTLGSGGNGIVFSALQHNPYRPVAIKFLKGVPLEGARRDRFNREIELLTRLDHPDIIKVFDAGTTAQGRAYFTMEYVEGKDIVTHCSDNAFSLTKRLELLIRLCHAVDHGHQHLVLHRDLKPSNVLITPANHLKLIDFGIGRLRYPDPDDELIARYLRRQGFDENYSSPELINNELVGVETDVYSLGIILHQLLTGILPRRSEPSVPSARSTEEHAHSLGFKSVASMRRVLTGDLDLIVMKAIDRIPGRRYHHPNDLAQDLHNFLSRMPIQARGPTLPYKVRLFVIRNPRSMAVTCALLFALMAATVTAILQKRAADKAAAVVREHAENLSQANRVIEQEKNHSMKTADVYRTSMVRLAKQLTQGLLQQRQALTDVYWDLAQQGTGDVKLDTTLVRRAMENADESDPKRKQMQEKYDALAKVNNYPERGPELARGPSPLAMLNLQLQIARTQFDADGNISDADGLNRVIKRSLSLMREDSEGAKTIRTSVCGTDATSTALRKAVPELEKLCNLGERR